MTQPILNEEMKLELPEGEDVDFKAGGFIQIEVPPHTLEYKEFDIEDEYHADWDENLLEPWKEGIRILMRHHATVCEFLQMPAWPH